MFELNLFIYLFIYFVNIWVLKFITAGVSKFILESIVYRLFFQMNLKFLTSV